MIPRSSKIDMVQLASHLFVPSLYMGFGQSFDKAFSCLNYNKIYRDLVFQLCLREMGLCSSVNRSCDIYLTFVAGCALGDPLQLKQ